MTKPVCAAVATDGHPIRQCFAVWRRGCRKLSTRRKTTRIPVAAPLRNQGTTPECQNTTPRHRAVHNTIDPLLLRGPTFDERNQDNLTSRTNLVDWVSLAYLLLFPSSTPARSIDIRGGNVAARETVHLVFHQCNQWRDNECKTVELQRSELKDERLTRARWHDDECVMLFEQGLNCTLLPRTKRFKSKMGVEGCGEIWRTLS